MRADQETPQRTDADAAPSFSPGTLSPRGSWSRYVYFALGWLCVAIGAIGVALPGLPTTPFMLIGLWCFSKSSARFERWLYHHRFFGGPLRAWRKHRVIALRYKLVAWTTMAVSGLFLAFSGASMLLLGSVVAVMLVGSLVIASFPNQIPEGRDPRGA